MPAQNRLDGDVYVSGTLQPVAFAAPPLCIGDAQVNPSSPLLVTKSFQQYKQTLSQDFQAAAVAASSRRVIHVAQAVGSIYLVRAGLVVPCLGAATVTVDIRKNGTTVLTAVITLNSSGVAYIPVAGSVVAAAYVAGDVFDATIVATVGGGTLGQGLFVDAVFRELPG